MNGFLWLGVMAVVATGVYFLVVLWPGRIPKDESVHGIISRIAEEDSE
jgi:hypothetical protein